MAAVVTAVLAALAPAGASAFQKAVWGPPTYRGVDQFPLYRSLGVRIYQTELDWNTVAPHKPKAPTSPKDPAYLWPAQLKQEITEARRYGMRVLIQVGNAPGWANGGHAGMGWAPKSPITYAQFVQAAARASTRRSTCG